MENRYLKVANYFSRNTLKLKVANAVRNVEASLNLKTDKLTLKDDQFELLSQAGALPMTGSLEVRGDLNKLSGWLAYQLGKPAMTNEIIDQGSHPDLMHSGVESEIVLARGPHEVEQLVERNSKDLAETKPIKTVYINDEAYNPYFTSFLE